MKKNKGSFSDIVIKGQAVERVKSYKYLGVVIDDTLSWKENVDYIVKKTHSRMNCLRKLRSFHVSQDLLQMFYSSIVSSIMSFGLTCWGGNVAKAERDRLDKIIKKAGGVVGRKQDDLQTMYNRLVKKKTTGILADRDHPLHIEFENRLIERSGRYAQPKGRTSRYTHSFIPTAIHSYNSHFDRSNINIH